MVPPVLPLVRRVIRRMRRSSEMAERSQIEKSNDFSASDQRPEGRPVGDVGSTKWQNKAKPKRAAIAVQRRNGRSESQSVVQDRARWQNEPELKVGSIFNASGESRMREMAERSQIENSNDSSASDQQIGRASCRER